ncbi:hypothetical protein HPB48_013191 [Haemaphysalis longicornis]|uniref:non-specific serine/threonine protein kinase n=1 Tax=Haemaphysalis longicornis TaxID=44386 RepID=A0A9J6FGF3_HAELO|nr:hypothetical protein HPB48_013191 [Haemaphysalis longicornis]
MNVRGCLEVCSKAVSQRSGPRAPSRQDFVCEMTVAEVQEYMTQLFIALRHVHSFDIIHRDVKPSNFLYSREPKRFSLVDFGLAQRLRDLPESPEPSDGESEVPENKQVVFLQPAQALAGRRRPRTLDQENQVSRLEPAADKVIDTFKTMPDAIKFTCEPPSDMSIRFLDFEAQYPPRLRKQLISYDSPHSKLIKRAVALTCLKEALGKSYDHKVESSFNNQVARLSKAGFLSRMISNTVPAKRQCLPVVHAGPPLHAINVHNLVKVVPATTPLAAALDLAKPVLEGAPVLKVAPPPLTPPAQRGKTRGCNCFGKNEVCNICLSRPGEVAPRAGTPGFRAPEVLMKYRGQTTAVDIWAAGVMMLCMLSGRYPFFRSQDDLTALAEIITVVGSHPVQLAAERMGKRLTLSHLKPTLDLKTLCEKLRGIRARNGLNPSGNRFRYHDSWLHVPDSAYDLLSKLLDPDPSSRITAEDALKHDFLRQPLQ